MEKTISPKRDRMARMFKYIIAGMTDQEALAKILKEEPKASTVISSLQWTRSQLRQNTDYAKKYNVKKVKIMTNTDLKNSRKPVKKAAKPAVSKPAVSKSATV